MIPKVNNCFIQWQACQKLYINFKLEINFFNKSKINLIIYNQFNTFITNML